MLVLVHFRFPGTLGARAGQKRQGEVERNKSSTICWVSFWHSCCVVWSLLFHVFSSGPRLCALGPFGVQRCPQGGFFSHLHDILGQGQHAKIDVLLRREFNSEDSEGSWNGQISKCFSKGGTSAALGDS